MDLTEKTINAIKGDNKPTAEELHKMANDARLEKTTKFYKDVKTCVDMIIEEMEDRLIKQAKNGKYELQSSINICDPKNYLEHDSEKFEDEVHKELKKYWNDRGFNVPKFQSNYFEIKW